MTRNRVSGADLMQHAGDAVSRQVGAVLVLEPGSVLKAGGETSAEDAMRLLADRVRLIPRFRQKLYRPPPGRGRPYWADAPAFEPRAHISEVPCPPPGDTRALLDVAAACLTEPLPAGRPPWSATFVTGLAGGRTALVVVVDHVMVDGVAGLTVLGRLADVPPAGFPSAGAPAGREGSARGRRPRLRAGLAEMGVPRVPHRAARSSLNRPAGPGRRIDVVTADLAAVREFGHARGGTVNDVVLAAAAGALRSLLAARGENLGQVAISVLVSARPPGAGGELGNQVGVMLVTVPADGSLGDRVTRTAAVTRKRKVRGRGSSAALLVPAFLLLARAGLLGWFVNHQPFVNTFVTNLRGPLAPLSFGGRQVEAIAALPATSGNVTVTFGVLSYGGELRITLLSAPDRVPDAEILAAALTRELAGLQGPRSRGPGPL